jgi:hypothetical protein
MSGISRRNEAIRGLVQVLLASAYLLPPDRLASDAVYLATSGADPASADPVRLAGIAAALADAVTQEAAEAITAAIAELTAAIAELTASEGPADSAEPADSASTAAGTRPQPLDAGREEAASHVDRDQPDPRVTRATPVEQQPQSPVQPRQPLDAARSFPGRPRPVPLTEKTILPAIREFAPLLDDNGRGRLAELEMRLTHAPAPEDWLALAYLCGAAACEHAAALPTQKRQLRLWQVAWWALQTEWRQGDAGRLSDRLDQLSSVLGAYSPRMRDGLIAIYFRDFRELITSHARQQFLEWFAGTTRDAAEEEVRVLRDLAMTRLAEPVSILPPDARVTPEPSTGQVTAEQVTGTSLDSLAALVPQALHGSLTHAEAIAAVENGWSFLDARKEEENRRRVDKARESGSGGPAVAPLALGALRSALWRSRKLDSSQPDAFPPEQLATVARLAQVVCQYSTHHNRAGVIGELASLLSMTVLLWELVSPVQYTRFMDEVAAKAPDDAVRQAIDLAGATELFNYVNRDAGQLVVRRNPEPWAEALAEWAARYDNADRVRLLDLLREAGVQESLALHALRGSMDTTSDTDSIFGPADEAAFESYFQQGLDEPIAALLEKSHRRLLAVAEADLSSLAQVEFLQPAGRVDIWVARRNIFSDLARKAREGDAAEAREAHSAFDKALQNEKRDDQRTVLTEWKAYALFRGRSIFAAEPVWAEAADNGHASKEVLWNLAVRRNQQGSPWRGLRYLLPGMAARRLPLSYLQFGCALAVATLRQSDGVTEGEPLYEEHQLARKFLLDYCRVLPVASMHLLWVWLVYSDPAGQPADSVGRALVTYNALRARPYLLPTVGDVGQVPHDQQLQAIDRVSTSLERLEDPCFRLTWRLWIGEYTRQADWWWPAWDRWVSACEADGDPGAAVEVLRGAAQSAVSVLQRKGLSDRIRETRSRFLRSAVIRLLRFARDRNSLLDEIRDRYVLPVPELCDPKRHDNAQLLSRLGLLTTTSDEDGGPTLLPGTDAWRSLYEDLSDVSDLDHLGDTIIGRIRAAATADPGTTGRNGQLVEAMLALLADIAALRAGIPADQASELLLKLSERNADLLDRVRAVKLQQLVAPLRVFERVLKNTASDLHAAPAPVVAIAQGWAGWPADYGASSVPIEVSFPGPGSATSVRIVGGWDSSAADDGAIGDGAPDYRPQAEVRGVRDIEADDAVAYALPLTAPAGDTWRVRVNVSYSWGPLTSLGTSVTLDVPRCEFSAFLGEHGMSAHEFPNPFIFDVPLTTEQVQGELFQGREQQLAEVRASYGPGGLPALPLCFYGIRKTGKTSLLRRVAIEVDRAGLVGLEVTLFGQRADTHTSDQLLLGLLTLVKEAAITAGARPEDIPLPASHPNPAVLIGGFFDRLADAFDGRRVVVLLDEFQFLLWGSNGEPVLDSLRPVHEKGRVGFIAFSNQGMDPTNKVNSQLGLRSIRVDFLRPYDVQRLVANPVADLGISVHPSAHRHIFELAAGHPNFSARLARSAVERLNLEHRNILTVSDVDAAAAEVLLNDGAFALSWFSRWNISPSESETAIRLAKEDAAYVGLELSQVDTRLGMTTDMARDLEAKRVVELVHVAAGARLRIRGRLLWEYLRRQVSVGEVPPPPSGSVDTVGIYVDLENLRSHKPAYMSYGEFGRKLISYAAGLGDLPARWIAIASWNTGEDWGRVKAELNDAGFRIAQEPSTFTARRRTEKRDVADFVLAGQVLDEIFELALTRVVLVTGDGDLLILVHKLLDKHVNVRLISGDARSRAGDYEALAGQRRAIAVANGLQAHEADFGTLLLQDVLS